MTNHSVRRRKARALAKAQRMGMTAIERTRRELARNDAFVRAQVGR